MAIRLLALNEGRGLNPGDTCTICEAENQPYIAQRRPGVEPRRHSPECGQRRRPDTLNEGRGLNPGDTEEAASVGDRAV